MKQENITEEWVTVEPDDFSENHAMHWSQAPQPYYNPILFPFALGGHLFQKGGDTEEKDNNPDGSEGGNMGLNNKYGYGDYHYIGKDGKIYVVTKSFYDKYNGREEFEELINKVNEEHNRFKQSVYQRTKDSSDYKLPEGYYYDKGYIRDDEGNYYLQSGAVYRDGKPRYYTDNKVYFTAPMSYPHGWTNTDFYKVWPLLNNIERTIDISDVEIKYPTIRDTVPDELYTKIFPKDEYPMQKKRWYAPSNPEADKNGFVYESFLAKNPLPNDEDDDEVWNKYWEDYNNWTYNTPLGYTKEGFNAVDLDTFERVSRMQNYTGLSLYTYKKRHPIYTLKGLEIPLIIKEREKGAPTNLSRAIYVPDSTYNIYNSGGHLYQRGGDTTQQMTSGKMPATLFFPFYNQQQNTYIPYAPIADEVERQSMIDASVLKRGPMGNAIYPWIYNSGNQPTSTDKTPATVDWDSVFVYDNKDKFNNYLNYAYPRYYAAFKEIHPEADENEVVRAASFLTAHSAYENAYGNSNYVKEHNNFGGDQKDGKPIHYDSVKSYMLNKINSMDKRYKGWSKAMNYGDYFDSIFQRELTNGHPTNLYDYDPRLGHKAYKQANYKMTSMRNAVQKYTGVDMDGF